MLGPLVEEVRSLFSEYVDENEAGFGRSVCLLGFRIGVHRPPSPARGDYRCKAAVSTLLMGL